MVLQDIQDEGIIDFWQYIWGIIVKWYIVFVLQKEEKWELLGGTLNEVKYKNQNIASLTGTQRITSFKKNTVEKSEYHQIFNLDDKTKWSFHRYY